MKFTLSATKQEANDTFSFIFAPEEPLQWKAGQLLPYVLNHPIRTIAAWSVFSQSRQRLTKSMLTTRFASKSSSFKKRLKSQDGRCN